MSTPDFFGDPKKTAAAAIAANPAIKKPPPPKKKKSLEELLGAAPPPPPVTSSAPPSAGKTLKALYEKYPQWKKYDTTIRDAAYQWGADPADLLVLLLKENTGADAEAKNKSGATGLAQILDTVVDKTLNPTRYKEFVRLHGNQAYANATNPVFSINYAAWRLAGGMPFYANVDDYYAGRNPSSNDAPRGYNPGYTGTGPSTFYVAAGVKDYQPKYAPTPAERAGKSKSNKDVAKTLGDPYVAGITRDGKMVTTGDPTKALKYDGLGLQVSTFAALKRSIEPFFVSYTGGRPSNRQVANYATYGWTEYTLADMLSKGKDFVNSPIYKKSSLEYMGAARDLLPKGAKINKEVLRQAIVNNWTIGALQEKIRQSGQYKQSNEYLNNRAVLESSYRNIYGTTNGAADKIIDHATTNQWTQPVFESYLRAQPQYQYSPEYQAKTVSFLDAMGLFIGARPVLREGALKAELIPKSSNTQNAFEEAVKPGQEQPIRPNAPLTAGYERRSK